MLQWFVTYRCVLPAVRASVRYGCLQLRRAAWGLVALATCLLVTSARAQVGVSAVVTPRVAESHAWVVIDDHADRVGAGKSVLVHVPPRTGDHPAPAGYVQFARTFEESPVAVAAWERTVYVVFEQGGDDGATRLRIRSVEAFDRGFSWDYLPIDRLEAQPTLVTLGTTQAVAARDGVVLVILSQAAGFSAAVLNKDAWTNLDLPDTSPGRWFAWATRESIVAAHLTGARLRLWSLSLSNSDDPTWIGLDELAGVADDAEVFTCGSIVAALSSDESRRVVSVLLPDSPPVDVATLDRSAGRWFVPVYVDGPRLLALRWSADESAGGYPRLESTEVSLSSGTILYQGPAPRSEILSAGEFRMLAMMLVALFIGVLVIVLKGDLDQDAVPLPRNTALAGPMRRFIASMIDLVIAAHVTGLLYDARASEILTLEVLLHPGGAWTALPALFIFGGVIGTFSEWLTGRTIGKFLTGMRVIRVRGVVGGRVGFVGCLVRNAIKWLMPPVAALAAVDENSRHRGDQIAGAAVIVDLEPEPEGP
ncbi:MAG: hypothetical protein D6695_01545 [Planctomycetota bacterium]|nr:MAG: hypothetical protein D6695_01545 [Planctomycetota bacterium]